MSVMQVCYDYFDQFMVELPLAVDAWADVRCREVARQVKEQLSTMPASGIFERADHQSIWDEYCLQIQHGPGDLESAFEFTVAQVLDPLIEALPRPDAVLLTLWRLWLDHRFDDPIDHETLAPNEIREGIIQQLHHLAEEVGQDWVTG